MAIDAAVEVSENMELYGWTYHRYIRDGKINKDLFGCDFDQLFIAVREE